MNKTEYIDAVAKAAGVSKVEATKVVAAEIAVITKALKKVTPFKLRDLVLTRLPNVLPEKSVTRKLEKKSKSLPVKLRDSKPVLC